MATASLKIALFSQARMTSTRLPGKIMMNVKGKSLLEYHTDRLTETGLPIVIATTTNASDDIVESFCTEKNLLCHRGSEDNVLERFYGANSIYDFDVIIRVTSDCPLVDASLIMEGVAMYREYNDPLLYISNSMPRTHARGFDFEIFSRELLDEAQKNAKEAYDREHVTPYIRENKPGNVWFLNVAQEADHGDFRVCVDTDEDFNLVKKLIEEFNADRLPYHEIEKLLIDQPELARINAHIIQKKK